MKRVLEAMDMPPNWTGRRPMRRPQPTIAATRMAARNR